MNILNDFLIESTQTADVAGGRPKLLTLTNAVNSLIFKDIAVTQETNSPTATLFGLRYLDPDGHQFYHTQSTYSGKIGSRNSIDLFDKTKPYNKNEVFKSTSDAVYIVTADTFDPTQPEYQAVEEIDVLFYAVLTCKIRMYSDAMSSQEAENPELAIQENKFKLDRWTVIARSRKLRSDATTELIQDLTAAGFGEDLIYDLLAKSIAEEINKDILQKLLTVSKRHETKELRHAIVDFTGTQSGAEQSRELYHYICEMASGILDETTYRANYCVTTPKVYAMLSASGWLTDNPNIENLHSGVLRNGLMVYIDTTTEFEYALVGTHQKDVNGKGIVGSIFYAPYTENDGVAYHVAIDPKSLHQSIMVNARYGLSVNPYTGVKDGQQVIPGDDWASHCESSKYSRLVGVKF